MGVPSSRNTFPRRRALIHVSAVLQEMAPSPGWRWWHTENLRPHYITPQNPVGLGDARQAEKPCVPTACTAGCARGLARLGALHQMLASRSDGSMRTGPMPGANLSAPVHQGLHVSVSSLPLQEVVHALQVLVRANGPAVIFAGADRPTKNSAHHRKKTPMPNVSRAKHIPGAIYCHGARRPFWRKSVDTVPSHADKAQARLTTVWWMNGVG
ncbi:hypothetical protein FQR65_LT20508 [Abscondita terminalis]|nr:hypothetical protein FQR65_LT20508 [Abscondita terminalis]